MRLSIGILAYNEASSIGRTIESVYAQDVFRRLPEPLTAVEVVCVPNGCKDDTADAARRAFEKFAPAGAAYSWRVVELVKGGKTNAWNEFVHSIADPASDAVMMLDGDVRLVTAGLIGALARELAGQPEALLASPRTIKHIALKERPTLFERLSLRLGELNGSRPHGFAGCCYMIRGAVARRIWFPEGMVGEDAFLNGLVLTDLCRSKEQGARVARALDERVLFEAYTKPGKVYRVLRRQAVTRGTNAILWTYLWATVTSDADAGEIIRRNNEADPEWYRKLIRAHVERSGWWVMPKGVLTRRLRYLRNLSVAKAVLMAPAALVGAGVDVVTHVAANRMIRAGRVSNLWETTRTTQI